MYQESKTADVWKDDELSFQMRNFIKYIKEVDYGEIRLVIQNGEPFKAEKGIKAKRFDL